MEFWRDAPGYKGRYEVSNQGNVRSYCRSAIPRLLKPGRSPSGHLTVALGRGNSQSVHILVLLAFYGHKPDGYECLHINGNPADNRLNNLRWGTRGENIRDKARHGLTKISLHDAACIREILKNNTRGLQSELARRYGVSPCTITDIKKGRTHV